MKNIFYTIETIWNCLLVAALLYMVYCLFNATDTIKAIQNSTAILMIGLTMIMKVLRRVERR